MSKLLSNKALIQLTTLGILVFGNLSNANATSDDECGIWLCLPTGFTTGCEAPHREFKKRIKAHKSPLPSFSSCVVNSGTNSNPASFQARSGVAAYIPSHQVCSKLEPRRDHGYNCLEWKTKPEEYVKGEACRIFRKDEPPIPHGCTQTYRYAEVYHNGIKTGETYYY